MKRSLRKKRQDGFTIVELMIATAVFATVLMLASFGLLQVARTYYKGVTITRTQETARTIMEQVADMIRFGAVGEVDMFPPATPSGFGCIQIGSQAFRYRIGTYRAEESTTGPFFARVSNCSASGGREFIGVRMRLSHFSVTPVGPRDSNTYRIQVRVISGDNDLLDGDQCRADAGSGSQFCAVSELSTVVQKRI